LTAAVAAAALAPAAAAAPTIQGEFDVVDMPQRLAQGSDGNIWVTFGGETIRRITPSGVVTPFDPPQIGAVTGITSANGRMWTTAPNQIGSFLPADPEGTDEVTAVAGVEPKAIVRGSDGNLWTPATGEVFKLTPSGATVTPNDITVTGLDNPSDIDAANGLIWISDATAPGQVFRVTNAGTVSPFDIGGMIQGVAAGPGSNAAYTQALAPSHIGRIQGGVIKMTPAVGNDPFGITLGTDGAYWSPRFASNPQALARVTFGGALSGLSAFSAASGPRQIAVGPNSTLWVGLEQANKVARVTGVTAPPATGGGGGGGGGGGPATDTTDPVITRLGLSRRSFRRGSRRPALLSRVGTGATIRFRLSEAAKVTFRFDRRTTGRRVRGRCRPRNRRNARRRRCVRWVRVRRRSFTVDAAAGSNRVRFQGKTSRTRGLVPGRYRLVARARDEAGNLSRVKRVSFRLLKPRPRRRR
jgi:streptogramin lyase